MSLLEIKNISKSFDINNNSLLVIDDFNFTAEKGDLIALTGPSGAGKSTLLHIIAGLDKPTKGSVIFNDIDIYSMKEQELNTYRGQNIGLVFQFHYLLDDFTAFENIMIPMQLHNTSKQDTINRAEELIKSVGLYDRKNHYPAELSGGEQQRIALARALANKPDMILADEPTGNLDKANSLAVFDLLKKQSQQGVCVIIVTHDEYIASECSKHIIMHKL